MLHHTARKGCPSQPAELCLHSVQAENKLLFSNITLIFPQKFQPNVHPLQPLDNSFGV